MSGCHATSTVELATCRASASLSGASHGGDAYRPCRRLRSLSCLAATAGPHMCWAPRVGCGGASPGHGSSVAAVQWAWMGRVCLVTAGQVWSATAFTSQPRTIILTAAFVEGRSALAPVNGRDGVAEASKMASLTASWMMTAADLRAFILVRRRHLVAYASIMASLALVVKAAAVIRSLMAASRWCFDDGCGHSAVLSRW